MLPERNTGSQRGQSTVEFAMVAPIIFIILLAVIDFGRGLQAYTAMVGAVRDGARYGSIYYSSPITSDDISTRVKNNAANSLIAQADLAVTVCNIPKGSTTCGTYAANAKGATLRVSATYTFKLITGFFGKVSIPITAQANSTFD